MKNIEKLKRPSKEEQKFAMETYHALREALEKVDAVYTEIEIEETEQKIKIPRKALELLAKILKATSEGKMVSVYPLAAEMTTQAAAELLGCSRPHLVKLLEDGEIEFTKVGKHRRVKFEDVMEYKHRQKEKSKEKLIQLMKWDEELGLYD